MKQEKLCLFVTHYTVFESAIELLKEFGLTKIETVCLNDERSARRIFAYDPSETTIVFDRNSDNDLKMTVARAGYRITNVIRIRDFLKEKNELEGYFETEEETEEKFI